MTLDEFKASLASDTAPTGISEELRGLWLSAKDGWESGHVVVQEIETADAAWVHAHLHRIEGDLANAGYWYRRAGRPACQDALDLEWDQIATTLLEA